MAVSGVLYTYSDNFRAHKGLIAAKYSGSDVKVVSGEPDFIYGETNKSADFLKKFPSGEVPAFESSDKKVHLTEGNAIAHYLANPQLRGETPEKQAEILQWINFSEHWLLPSVVALSLQALGSPVPNTQESVALEELKKGLALLNTQLSQHKYIVGDQVTLADVTLYADLVLAFTHVIDGGLRGANQNVTKWFQSLGALPQFKSVVGEVKLHGIDKKGAGDKKEKKEKAKEEKPKEEKKSKKKEEEEPEEEMDAAEAALAAEPKEKDPFQALPKGTFDVDEFKRVYSNEDTLTKAIPYFWDKFDTEHYSLWYGEYKFPQELEKVFMSCNLITGMFQRLDKMRKQAFGSVILFGSDNNSTISGVWLWRGQDLAFNLSPDWQVDYESYDWKKLDAKDEKTKKLVNEYLAWEGDFDGKKFNQGKIFK